MRGDNTNKIMEERNTAQHRAAASGTQRIGESSEGFPEDGSQGMGEEETHQYGKHRSKNVEVCERNIRLG